MFGPVLRGERVTLRPPEDGDPARFVEWLADPEATRYLTTRFAMSLTQEQEWFKKTGEAADVVLWIVEAEGRAIGNTSIGPIDWVNAHAITGTFIGDRTAWGRGYGREAMALRTGYAFRWLNLHKLNSAAFSENEPSRRALRRAGYREIGLQREHSFRGGCWHDHVLLELLRSDWESSAGREILVPRRD